MHKTAATDDKKLQSNLKKLSVTNIPGIEEVGILNWRVVLFEHNGKVRKVLFR